MTVVARRFLARPVRGATETWAAIVDCVCKSDPQSRREFEKITGEASALIASDIMKEYPFVIMGSGPRLRVYCLYDEDAISGDDKNEEPLGWNPTEGDCMAYLPCTTEECDFFKATLHKKTSRIKCYDVKEGIPEQEQAEAKSEGLTIDIEGFRKL
jgi:hypothetical protein